MFFTFFTWCPSGSVQDVLSHVLSGFADGHCPELSYNDALKNMRLVVEVLRAVDLKRVGLRSTAAVSRGAEMQDYIKISKH